MATWTAVANKRAQQRAPTSRLGAVIAQSSGEYPVRDPDPSIYANQSELYRRLSWVYGAVSRVAESVASLANLNVMTLAGEKKSQVVNHPFEQLLRRPNPYQFDSRFEFYEALTGFYKLNGNAYIWLNALESTTNPPIELWLLRPDRVTIVPHKTKFIKGYLYEIEGEPIPFDADEIVHLKSFHPLNDWYGLSAIEALALAAETDLSASAWNRNFFSKDNAKPQGALAYAEFYEDEPWEKIKADVLAEHGGNKRRMMMLRGAGEGGVEWLNMGVSQKDMEFLGSRQFNKEEIYATLAPGLVQAIDKNTTEANSIAGEKTYREYALYPILQRIAEKFTARIMPRYGENLVCEFEEIRIRDRNLALAEIAAYERTHTIKEVRAKHFNDEPLGDERDALFVNQVTAPQPVLPDMELFGSRKPTEPIDSTAATSERQDDEEEKALTAAKALERKQFKAFARKNATRAGEFKFRFLDADEAKQLIEQHSKLADAKARADHDGIMLALPVPENIGKQLLAGLKDKLPAGSKLLDLNELHITLAYLGEAGTYERDVEAVAKIAQAFASTQGSLRGRINGVGAFTPVEGDQVPFYATFDCKALNEFQLRLQQTLNEANIPFKREHGFVPHITLAYVPVKSADELMINLETALECTFDKLVLAWAGEWREFPLREYVDPLPELSSEFGKALAMFTQAITDVQPIASEVAQ